MHCAKNTAGFIFYLFFSLIFLYGCSGEQQSGNSNQTQGQMTETPFNKALGQAIDFAKPGYPSYIAGVKGLSIVETIGRWSDGKLVLFAYKQVLPQKFTLVLTLAAFGSNVNAPINVKCGDVTKELVVGKSLEIYRIPFNTAVPVNTIEFTIPHPESPKSLRMNDDTRMLGILFRTMMIE